jgi:hypothetical protein
MLRRGARARRGAAQLSLTVRATVLPGSVDELRSVLERVGGQEASARPIPFPQLAGVHFARLFLLEDSTDLDGALIPASLVWQSEIDAPLERHLDQLVDLGGPGLDATFGLCEGYPADPTAETRRAYLLERYLESAASYVNTVGRTVAQIHREAELREAIEDFLDRRRAHEGLPADPVEVRAEIQRFVRSEPSLTWAKRRAPRPGLRWRLGELGHALGIAAVLLLAAPLALALLPVYAILLRLHERADPAPHVHATPEHEQRLAAIEDHVTQNQFSAIGYVKPGLFRRLTAQAVLWLTDVAARHVFNRASLAGIKTIHFAHWTVLDDWRRIVFSSNYDGSHESYMDDFIDKVAFGLNASFSNGVGYPKTRFLLFEGARREQEFKDWQRFHQLPTQVWYSAYEKLTALNIENNALIRSGLFGTLARADTEAWLRRL